MEKLKMHSPNLTQDNIARIRELFPGCVTEAKDEDGSVKLAVDFDQLRQELSDSIVEGPQERYHLNWPGKREALLTANAPIAKTLRPCRDESVDFDSTRNLFIEGDNLDALKLLQETYLGKVKMIYIDPPYNTGNDFIYPDNFSENSADYFARSNQTDKNGAFLIANTESNGRFHSVWLSMMYSRLRMARNLLKEDGVIFISIDDGEVANLRKVCEEIFGEINFLAHVVWQKKYGPANDANGISQTHEHLLVYGKNASMWTPALLPRNEEQLKAFKNPDDDPRGAWRASDLSARTFNPNCVYPIVGPHGDIFTPPASRAWIVSESRYKELQADNRITFGSNGKGRPMQKKFLSEVKDGITPETWWDRDKVGDNKIARYEMKALFPENVFDTPKPTRLIEYAAKIANMEKNDILMDFFSGSATTAHAVMKINTESSKNIRYILVQMPETCSEQSEAHKIGLKNIADIGKERIRRAGSNFKQDKKNIAIDIGFRVLKIDTSNMADVYYAPDALDKTKFDLFVDNIKPDRTPEDLLFQVMLDWGVDLALPITKQSIQGKDVFFVDGNVLAACFDASGSIDEAFVKELAKHQPLRVVFRDAGYKNSAVKINVEQIFKLLSPATEVKCI